MLVPGSLPSEADRLELEPTSSNCDLNHSRHDQQGGCGYGCGTFRECATLPGSGQQGGEGCLNFNDHGVDQSNGDRDGNDIYNRNGNEDGYCR